MTSDILKRAAEAVEGTTPGPWRVVIDDDGNPLSGRPSVSAAEEYDCAIIHWDGFVQEYWRSARGDKEIHANARFIAAARTLIPDMAAAIAERDAEIERLKTDRRLILEERDRTFALMLARAEAAEAQVANAGAVMVEACAQAAIDNQDCSPWEIADEIRALSTLSPIAAAARVLLAQTPNPVFDLLKPALMGEVSQSVTYLDDDGNEYSDRRMVSWEAMKDVLRLAFRALAEQEKADG